MSNANYVRWHFDIPHLAFCGSKTLFELIKFRVFYVSIQRRGHEKEIYSRSDFFYLGGIGHDDKRLSSIRR
jgi:hypothetical protein